MAKGKNHDRKANAGFGKVKSKSSSGDGEFTLKRVKGEPLSSTKPDQLADGQARTFTAMRNQLPESRCSAAGRLSGTETGRSSRLLPSRKARMRPSQAGFDLIDAGSVSPFANVQT